MSHGEDSNSNCLHQNTFHQLSISNYQYGSGCTCHCGPLFRFSNNCAQHAKDAAQKLCLTDQSIEIVFYFCELHLFPPPQYVKLVQFSGFLKILPPMHVEGPARCPRKWPMPISVGCPHQLHKQGGVVLPGNTNWDKFSIQTFIVSLWFLIFTSGQDHKNW